MRFWYTCRMPASNREDQEQGLRHQLGAGQMAMVAVGGSIGTGLLLGSAAALEIAGPGVILSFALAPFITLTVTLALGELSSLHPRAGSFGGYGCFEYWFGMIKVVTIVAFGLLGAGLLLTGRVAPQYTAHGGFLPKGALAPLLAMGFALYTFAGLELVAVTTGESRSAHEIPRAIKLTFATLAF